MALFYIYEYVEAAVSRNGVNLPIGKEPSVVNQTPISFGGGTEQSQPFSSTTTFIRVTSDTDCFIVIGPPVGEHLPYTSPVATATDGKPIWAKGVEYFGVKPGHILSVVDNGV